MFKNGFPEVSRLKEWRSRLQLEFLEPRCLLSQGFRTIDGSGNNVDHPDWGMAGIDLLRTSPVAYADGISAPSTPNTLSARQISNDLNNQSDPIFSGLDNLGGPQSRSLSDFAYVWGQFTDHDLDLTPTQSGPGAETFDIPADPTRPDDRMGVEPFTRSVFDPKTGTSTDNPRRQINVNTSFQDLSQVYGSTDFVADALRTHAGGQLKTSPGDLLPFNDTTYFTAEQLAALNMANDAHQVPDSQLFVAGDVRANENVELTALHILFLRNHNRLATQLQSRHPRWTDEHLYQEARKLNIAESEIVTYTEFLPAIFGSNPLPEYTGYHSDVNPAIATEFSTVGFRFGHSLLSNTVGRNENDGTNIEDVNPHGAGVNLLEDFFRPDLINPDGVTVNLVDRNGMADPHTSSNVDAIVKADADNAANEMDLLLIDEIRNGLFSIPFAPGTDLAARDVQRTRDHGIGTYNQVRVAYGLPPATTFAMISSDPDAQAALQDTYGTPDQVDPFEGMLAEDHIPGTDTGPTERAIVLDQFQRLRDGDRFFYLNEQFTLEELALIRQGNSLAKVIKNNTDITNLQGNVFFFRENISGSVFFDPDGDGVRQADEPGIPGVTVNLVDDSGMTVASAVTDVTGRYDFTDRTGIPRTGNFTLEIVMPPEYAQNETQVEHNPGEIHLSRGGLNLTNQNFALLLSSRAEGAAAVTLVQAQTTQTATTAITDAPTPAMARNQVDAVFATTDPGAQPVQTVGDSFDQSIVVVGALGHQDSANVDSLTVDLTQQ
jgi:hypothetical protein